MKSLTFAFIVAAAMAAASEKKIKLQDLPPAVRQAVTEHAKEATLVGLAREVENGRTLYEAELRAGGRGKDVTFDDAGKLVSVEEEIALDAVPSAARDAIQKSVGKSRIRKLEAVTENGATVYEAHFRRGLRAAEVKVDAAGRPVK